MWEWTGDNFAARDVEDNRVFITTVLLADKEITDGQHQRGERRYHDSTIRRALAADTLNLMRVVSPGRNSTLVRHFSSLLGRVFL